MFIYSHPIVYSIYFRVTVRAIDLMTISRCHRNAIGLSGWSVLAPSCSKFWRRSESCEKMWILLPIYECYWLLLDYIYIYIIWFVSTIMYVYIYIYHIPLKAWSVIGSIHELGGRGNWGPSPAQAADMLEDFGVVWGLSVYSAVREIYGE